MPMMKVAVAVLAAATLGPAVARAQSQIPSTNVAPGRVDPYAHDPYITSTGATVAHPGQSQSGGTTPQERAIQHQDNKIDKSICKGC